jgi:hypothetical protein
MSLSGSMCLGWTKGIAAGFACAYAPNRPKFKRNGVETHVLQSRHDGLAIHFSYQTARA